MGTTDEILRVVHDTTGVDFSAYRPQTAERRIRTRMIAVGINNHADYARLLRDSTDEVQLLIDRLTIKVSRFYRNPPVFDALRAQVLPALARLGRPLRIWSAGSSRGEEAYTLAMLLEDACVPGEVVATDVDPLALQAMRKACYSEAAITDLPASWATRYLRPSSLAPRSYEVSEAVKRRVVVEQADLMAPALHKGAPFDLICCRNVLIYWSSAAQHTMLNHMLSRLEGGGWLCLGEAEWLDPEAFQLEVVSARLRLFHSKTTAALA